LPSDADHTVAYSPAGNERLEPRPATRSDPGADDPTVEPKTQRRPEGVGPPDSTVGRGRFWEVRELAKDLLKRHERKIWWLHTAYALGLGAFVATLAQKGLERARFLAIALGVAWLLFILFFKFFGTGARQDFMTAWPGARRRFFVMTYILKNLFQTMLFFLLPFYWKSSTWDGKNWWFVFLVGGCAMLSTLDLVFDRLLMRFKLVASIFYAVTLFGSLNLIIPALSPDTSALRTLMVAAGVTVAAFWMLHVPVSAMLHKGPLAAFVLCLGGGLTVAYFGREAVPPVPMHVAHGGVGAALTADGTLATEVVAIHEDHFGDLIAVTEVSVLGSGDRLYHVWRHDDAVVQSVAEPWPRAEPGATTVRIQSELPAGRHPSGPEGDWSVDVETEEGQLVGRVAFRVTR
jgi:hypothetical protein